MSLRSPPERTIPKANAQILDHHGLEIPVDVWEQLLPDRRSSILQFLQFPLAVISVTTSTHPVSEFFSDQDPSIHDPASIRAIPTPPVTTVKEFEPACKNASAARSIVCLHITAPVKRYLPLWVVTYWLEVIKLHMVWRDPWVLGEASLQRRYKPWKTGNSGETADLIEEVRNLLSSLPWHGDIQGFDNKEPIHSLATYTTRAWLTDVHANQMLDLLRRTLQLDRTKSKIEVENLQFYKSIQAAYNSKDSKEYEDSRYFACPRWLGQALALGERDEIVFEANIQANHWVTIIVNFRNQGILYGDSLHDPLDADLLRIVQWWTQHHTGCAFAWESLVVPQQTDGYSCGLLAWNGAAHYCSARQYPLMDPQNADNEHLKILLQIVKRHDDYQQSFENVSENFEFTFTSKRHDVFESDSEASVEMLDLGSAGTCSEPRSTPGSAISLQDQLELMDVSSSSHVVTSDSDGDVPIVKVPKRMTRMIFTPPSSPGEKRTSTKETRKSAICIALDQAKETASPKGLLRYLKPVSPSEHAHRMAKIDAEAADFRQDQDERAMMAKETSKNRACELGRLRQQRYRAAIHKEEIANGKRKADGTKRRERTVHVELEDRASKRLRSIAELSRPNRAEKELAHQRNKRPQGRKCKNNTHDAVYHNWHSPFLWSQILEAAKDSSVGVQMGARRIVKVLRTKNHVDFSNINSSTIESWIDRTGEKPKWSDAALRMAELGNHQGHNKGGQRGILAAYPEVTDAIVERLTGLRNASAPITLVTVRAIMVAMITRMAPEIFVDEFRDGSVFRCSDSFLHAWLHKTLKWSERKSTRAGHKLPEDWEDKCEQAFFRIAYGIKEHDIPAELYVNSDQTQVVLAQGTDLTWGQTGAKQVSVLGAEEKCAITVLVSVSSSGELLPFQAIHQGYTERSCPSVSSPHYEDCMREGMRFEFSLTRTYWSTQCTMQNFVIDILVPYFTRKKQELGLPASQTSLWQIDVWSVHRSKEFRSWLQANHPTILLDYIPAGTTGLFQPCDVGIQRIFKHSLKRSYHEDIVKEILNQIYGGVETITIEKTLKTLRDHTVKWMWDAYQILNNEAIVKKAFEMCRVKDFNLSYDTLTSREARERLRKLRLTDPSFYEELTAGVAATSIAEDKVIDDEDHFSAADVGLEDDSNLPCDVIISRVLGVDVASCLLSNPTGGLSSADLADFPDESPESLVLDVDSGSNGKGSVGEGAIGDGEKQESGAIGKRKRRANTLYASSQFWRHHDNDDSGNKSYS